MPQPSTSTYVVLDTNAILQAPSSVTYKAPGVEFLVPQAVLSELSRSSAVSGSAMSSLVVQASVSGTVVIPPDSPFRLVQGAEGRPRLSDTDRQVLSVAAQLKQNHPSSRVVIASDDRAIQLAAAAYGVEPLPATAIPTLVNTAGATQPLRRELQEATAAERRTFQRGIAIGLILGVGGALAVYFARELYETISYWGTAVALPVLAAALYRLRSRLRLAYGLGELLFGLLSGLYVILPVFAHAPMTFNRVLPFVAALYVMVRGLDNLGQGLRGTTLEPTWRRFLEGG